MSTDEPGPDGGQRQRRSAEQLAGELRKLGDELRWRNHRAVAEVRDAVHLVAGELERTAATLWACEPLAAGMRDEARVQGHLALLEAKDKLTLLDDVVRRALHGAALCPSFLGEAARLKLALAKLEAADLFEEKRRLLEEERKRLNASTELLLREVDAHVARIMETIAQRSPPAIS